MNPVAGGYLNGQVGCLVAGFQSRRRGELEETRAQAEEVVALRTQLQERIDAVQELVERRDRGRTVIRIISELAELLPDDTWLSQLDIKREHINVNGESAAASQLIGVVEASPYFSSARFVSPVIRSRIGEGERFQLSIAIDHGQI